MKKLDAKILAHFDEGASELVFWTFRYFLGRQTIATYDFAERLAIVYPMLTDRFRALIRKELDEAFRRDDESRATDKGNKNTCGLGYWPLGRNCDRAAWDKVRKAYNVCGINGKAVRP